MRGSRVTLAGWMVRAQRALFYRIRRGVVRIACEAREFRKGGSERLQEQVSKFDCLRLDRDMGLHAIDSALAASGYPKFDEDDDMFSEHLVLLGALSIKQPDAEKVLEIGTYDGRTALILAMLFPRAEVTTLDLPAADPSYGDSYQQARSRDFTQRRDAQLRKNPRINFLEINSLNLTQAQDTSAYDVIWVDGDHDFPVVGIDLANAVRLLRPGGYLLCDDVVTTKPTRSTTYLSIAAHRTLGALLEAGLIEEPVYIYKRLGKKHQFPRKFVAITQRRGGSRAR